MICVTASEYIHRECISQYEGADQIPKIHSIPSFMSTIEKLPERNLETGFKGKVHALKF
jgi:hypothetical protein